MTDISPPTPPQHQPAAATPPAPDTPKLTAILPEETAILPEETAILPAAAPPATDKPDLSAISTEALAAELENRVLAKAFPAAQEPEAVQPSPVVTAASIKPETHLTQAL